MVRSATAPPIAGNYRGPGSRAAVTMLVGAILAAIVAACGVTQGPTPAPPTPGDLAAPGSGAATASPPPSLPASPTAEPSVVAASPGALPAAVPGFPDPYPGAEIIGSDVLQGTSIVVHELLYDVPAGSDDVRAHYRKALREGGWRIGEVELDGTEWELEAVRGGDEIEVEIEPVGDRSRVEVTMSLPVAP